MDDVNTDLEAIAMACHIVSEDGDIHMHPAGIKGWVRANAALSKLELVSTI